MSRPGSTNASNLIPANPNQTSEPSNERKRPNWGVTRDFCVRDAFLVREDLKRKANLCLHLGSQLNGDQYVKTGRQSLAPWTRNGAKSQERVSGFPLNFRGAGTRKEEI